MEDCSRQELNDLLGPYAAGRLSGAEVEAVEVHLLECPRCRSDLRTGLALRAVVPTRATRHFWLVPGGLIAAAITISLLTRSPNPYEALGRLTALPAYHSIPVRTGAALSVIDSGMSAYERADYRSANRLLARGVADANQPGAWFFYGVTHLILGEPARALAPLRSALLPPDNPYSEEARFFAAKAFLQLGQPDSARFQLESIRGDRLRARATELLNQIPVR